MTETIIIIVYDMNYDEILWKGAFTSMGKLVSFLGYELNRLQEHDPDAYYTTSTHVDGGIVCFHYDYKGNPKKQYNLYYRILTVDLKQLKGEDHKVKLARS